MITFTFVRSSITQDDDHKTLPIPEILGAGALLIPVCPLVAKRALAAQKVLLYNPDRCENDRFEVQTSYSGRAFVEKLLCSHLEVKYRYGV